MKQLALLINTIANYFGFFLKFFFQTEEAKAQEAQKKEQQQIEKLKVLFSECKIFLSREVPREIIVFVVRYMVRTSVPSEIPIQFVFCDWVLNYYYFEAFLNFFFNCKSIQVQWYV